MALAVEAQLDALVDEALAVQAIAEAGLREQLDRALLEHAGADAVLDVLAAAVLEDDGVDPLEVEEVREQEPGGARAHDSDHCSHLSDALPCPRCGREYRERHAVAVRRLPEARPSPPRHVRAPGAPLRRNQAGEVRGAGG